MAAKIKLKPMSDVEFAALQASLRAYSVAKYRTGWQGPSFSFAKDGACGGGKRILRKPIPS